MQTENVPHLVRDLALCNTDHPADAVSLLLRAAAEILYPGLGLAASIEALRGSIDDVEAAMVGRYGRANGEPVQ